jgi:hypothetical protein
MFGAASANVIAINIAVNSSEGLKSSKLIDNPDVAEVSRMPDFIALFEMFENCIIKKTMCIGQKTYFHNVKIRD